MKLSRLRKKRVVKRSKPFALAAAAAFGLAVIASSSGAEAQTIDLGTAANFAVLGGQTVTNIPTSTITGDVGVWPGTAIVGITAGDGQVNGTLHAGDAVALLAQSDLVQAHNTLMNLGGATLLGPDLSGTMLTGGLYRFASAAVLNAPGLTLNGQGNSASEWLFQIPSTLTVGPGAAIIFTNGANPANVYWGVGSSAVIGPGATFAGNILALTSITLETGATIVCGSALARNGAVTMDMNTITICAAGGDDEDITEDELGGEGVTGAQNTALDASRLFGSTMLAQTVFPYLAVGAPGTGPQQPQPEKYTPLKVGPSDTEPASFGGDYYQARRWRVWAAGLGGSSSLDGDRGSGTLDTDVGGVAGGLDYRFNSTALVGIAGGYTDSNFSVNELRTNGTTEGAHVGIYGVKSFGRFYLAGTAEYAGFDNETDRTIDWVVDERARGSFDSNSFGGRVEAGWRRPFGRHFVTPFVGMDAYELDLDGFTETSQRLNGAPGLLGLTFESESVMSVTSSVGLQFDTTYALANDRWLTPFVRVAWVHEYDPDRIARSFLTNAPAASFLVDGASAAENVARVNAGLRLDLSERIALWGFFEGEFGDGSQSSAGVGGGDVAFVGSGQGQNYAGRVGMKVRW
jgi:uncharacterized protein YhjY with autotransporter beta-barrel domain